MFYQRKDKAKKYNIIIIPERGSHTKKISLSSVILKTTLVTILIFGVGLGMFVYVFFSRYHSLNENITVLKKKEDYIRTLEEDNKSKEEEIQNYKVYEDSVRDKIEALNELEQNIKEKLDKSNFFNDTTVLNDMAAIKSDQPQMQAVYLAASKTPVETIESKIKSLESINEKLDHILEKEQYIPSFVPAKGRITSYFGLRANPFTRKGEEDHPAIDIANNYGTKIHATAKGRVVYAEYKKGFGNAVYLDHGNGFTSLYGHASELLVEAGQIVEKGEVIALMGSTGRSTGSHVHFELRRNGVPINPIKIFE